MLPAPETTRTLLVEGLTPQSAVATMTSFCRPLLRHQVPAICLPGIEVSGKPAGAPITAFRLEGVPPSVDFRLNRLRELLASKGLHRVLDRDESLAFWREVRDAHPFARDTSRLLWRISVPPAQGAEVLARIERALPNAQSFLDWGGGLIWLQLESVSEACDALASAEKIRAAVATVGGHATLIRANADVRRSVDVFQPQPAALAALSNRVKAQFDPKQVLNPGRLYVGV